jgi:glucose-6-phosphate dehydrogenase assembly protein OpcA
MLKRIDTLSYDIRDMNWGMTGPWRDVMAQVFNSADRIKQLREAKSLLIEYNKVVSLHLCETIFGPVSRVLM